MTYSEARSATHDLQQTSQLKGITCAESALTMRDLFISCIKYVWLAKSTVCKVEDGTGQYLRFRYLTRDGTLTQGNIAHVVQLIGKRWLFYMSIIISEEPSLIVRLRPGNLSIPVRSWQNITPVRIVYSVKWYLDGPPKDLIPLLFHKLWQMPYHFVQHSKPHTMD